LEYELNKKIGCNAPFSAEYSTEIAGIVSPANSEMNDLQVFDQCAAFRPFSKKFCLACFHFFSDTALQRPVPAPTNGLRTFVPITMAVPPHVITSPLIFLFESKIQGRGEIVLGACRFSGFGADERPHQDAAS
jgi:hypothetical protein